MKKFLCSILILILLIAATACVKPQDGYDTYFNGFASAKPYTEAVKLLDLSEYEEFKKDNRQVYFSGYDSTSDIYIISEYFDFGGASNYTLSGFATESEVLVTPKYISILDISGDYAIVSKMIASGDKITHRVGLVKIKGENKGAEFGFSYNYAIGITQYSFLDDRYMVMLGHKDMQQSASSTDSLSFTFATVYDYTSANGEAILEVGRVGDINNGSKIYYNEGNLLTVYQNTVRFYRIDEMNESGIFIRKSIFYPLDTTQGFDPLYIDTVPYYIGNDWYIITGIFTSTSMYNNYEIMETSGDTTYYMTVKSVKLNTKTYKSFATDRITLVANKYNDKYIRGLSDMYNISEQEDTDAVGTRGVYYPPVVPSSSAVKDGYSIVYYYYDFWDGGIRYWDTSFSVYDQNGNRKDIEGILFPLIFVDGIGWQSGDPNFQMPFIEAAYYEYNRNSVTLDIATETIGYVAVLAHSDMIIADRFDVTRFTTYSGAYDKDGNLAVPFYYQELTPFFGNFATGSKLVGSEDDSYRVFYKIAKTGGEDEIQNVYALKNGVYITQINDLYGLYANDGTKLINEKCDSISVIDVYLKDGLYMKKVITTVENGCGVLYGIG